MHNIPLEIRTRDWFFILLIGMVFAMMLSSLGYFLLQKNWFFGAVFGSVLGFFITTYSLLFISFMNIKILPNIKEMYWMPLAAFFSFLAGFVGAITATFIAKVFDLALIEIFQNSLIVTAAIIGLLTYLVGLLLYFLVNIRNQKEQIDHEYVQSRLRSLETQLNPHFLFNALNSIAELIHHDKDKAEMAILKVSSFLRNTMDEKALLPLKDEMRNVQDYIELENIRFSGKIHLNTVGKIPNWNTPKFSIQLIVENAIKHGLLSDKESLNIEVSFDEKKKTIKIKNDGKEMQKIRFGVGLNNLKQRLELLCKGDLSVENLQNPMFYIYLGECCENTNS